ncbi:Malate:quinone oxidoreductase [Campylobacter coli]|nr:Malate:quinone oxidoreductase [Campylobacter coli]
MTQQEFDVIVIGAGISGAALFTSLQDILILKILL